MRRLTRQGDFPFVCVFLGGGSEIAWGPRSPSSGSRDQDVGPSRGEAGMKPRPCAQLILLTPLFRCEGGDFVALGNQIFLTFRGESNMSGSCEKCRRKTPP